MATTYSFVFNTFKDHIYQEYQLDGVDNGFKIVLVNSSFVDSLVLEDNKKLLVYNDLVTKAYIISNTEIDVGPTYVENNGNGKILKAYRDANWLMSTIDSAYGAVVYDSLEMLVCYIDFFGPKSTQNGTFSVPLTKGIIQTP